MYKDKKKNLVSKNLASMIKIIENTKLNYYY